MTIQINNRTVEALPGETLIETAGRAGIDIPRLCYARGAVHKSSCMVCVVKDVRSGQIMPSCTTLPAEGMQIDAGSDEVLALRKASLELLLSDHRADCEAPCRVACPGSLDIAAMNRLYATGHSAEALALLRNTLVIPATLCYICNAPCEKICRRNQIDATVEIREIKKLLVHNEKEIKPPAKAPANGKKAAVLNSSPAGLAIGYGLMRLGYDVTVAEPVGDFLLPYIESGKAPAGIVEYELKVLEASGLKMMKGVPAQGDFDVTVGVQAGTGTGPTGDFTFTAKTKQPARQVEEGRMFAVDVDRQLSTGISKGTGIKLFNSSFPKLTEKEIEIYRTAGLEDTKTRCLFCDCNSKTDCRLRDAATALSCRSNAYNRQSSRMVERRHISGRLYHEPAKCIACGLCVYNTANGFTFSGRGFDMKVALPAGNEDNVPDGIAKLCPTGALYLKM
jgi:predicted molibdopterin-dependent oxidoreductase YjgC